MKKTLLILATLLIIAQCGFCAAATTGAAQSIIDNVKSSISTNVSNAVTSGVNSVKLASYKAQLTQKQQELEELEESSTNVCVKWIKKFKLNRKISDLETNIKELEAAGD